MSQSPSASINRYVNQGHCDDGVQDQPAAAFDTTVFPPRLWVAWRHNGSGGTYGACVQYFDIDPIARAVIPSPNPPQEVQNLDRTPFYGVGGLIVRAQNSRVSLVYSNSDHHWDCPTSPDKEMKWFSVSSDDAGVSWTPSNLIRDTTTFAPCLAANNMSNEMRTFGFINDSSGDYYVALPVAKDQIEVWRSTTQGDSWLPGPVWTTFARGGSGSRAQPFLASDGASRLGLMYYETDTATDTRVTPRLVAATNAASGFWDPPQAAGSSFVIDTAAGPCSQNTQQCRTLGDYAGIAARVKNTRGPTYLPAWTAFPPGRPNVVGEERATAVAATVN